MAHGGAHEQRGFEAFGRVLRCQFFPHPGQRSPRRGLQRKQAAAGKVCVAELDESMTRRNYAGASELNAQFGTLTDRRISARSCRLAIPHIRAP